MKDVAEKEKTIACRSGKLKNLIRRGIFNHWCLHRSRLIYAILRFFYKDKLRINIVMRCRSNSGQDWGHAWVTINGTPFLEWSNNMILKSRVLIADTGKYMYWIYE